MEFIVRPGQCQRCPPEQPASQSKTIVRLDNGSDLSLCWRHFRVALWFDGACEPNPGGHASYGCAVTFGGVVVQELTGYVGRGPEMTNNVAEYSGLLAGLRFLSECGLDKLLRVQPSRVSRMVAYGDSRLVVEQMSGRWKVKKGLYVPYYRQAWDEAARWRGMRFEWIPRIENAAADKLAKDVLREKGVKFYSQPE